MKQLEILIFIIKDLGGKAAYKDIYSEYEKRTGKVLTCNTKAGIRKLIEDNSSDSANFKGNDLFYSVFGKGKGVWGLRSNIVKNN